MTKIRKMLLSLALVGSAAIATPAAAKEYNFAFDDRTVADSDFSFRLLYTATPDFTDELGFGFESVPVRRVLAGSTQQVTSDISFFLGVEGGGLALDFDDLRGAQLFTGSTTAPTFRFGTFDLSRFNDLGDLESVGAITISAIPETSTWMMMIMGFGTAGATLRRRKNVTARLALS